MEPYRTAALRCPTCPETPLREFSGRLICDECQGMLIDEDDLAKACSDLVTRDVTLVFADETPSTTACPRCERALATAQLRFEPLHVKTDVLRCTRDGVWLRGGQLVEVFARLGRKAEGVIGYPQYASPVATGIDGLPNGISGPATSGLIIGQYRARRHKPLTPINAYADRTLACPVCTTAELAFHGDRYVCAQCAGTFVQNAAFEAMAQDISNDYFELPAPTGEPGPRACPVCAQAMVVDAVEKVAIDRCAAHGIWFDANELSVALERASGQFDRGIRGWLRRIFAAG